MCVECDITDSFSSELYTLIKEKYPALVKIELLYKKDNKEYITEKISIEWLGAVDAHTFHNWLELKRTQKQKYNAKDYKIIVKLQLTSHTNR